jgi:hypothetical protein
MWRVTQLLTRAPTLSRDEMMRGLADEHMPRLLQQAALRSPHLERAILCAAYEAPGSNIPVMFDASMELWFDSEDAAGQALAFLTTLDPVLTASAARFVSSEKCVAWMGEYFERLKRDRVRLRLIVSGDIADGCTVEDALRYWADVHPVVAQTAPAFWAYLQLYAQVHGRRVPGVNAYRPMAADVGFASVEDFVSAYAHEQYLSIVRPDEIKFSKPGDMLAFATTDQRTVFARA